VADLYARGVHERARALIDVAHPDFREELERTANELGLLAAARAR
jgi:acyl-CoA hydrolase